MTRCIAILTLALTAALSADQAFALDPGDAVSGFSRDEVSNGFATGDNLRGSIAVNGVADEEDDLDALIAIIAFESGDFANAFCGDDDIWVFIAERFEIDRVVISAIEYGPEAAYVTLRDMGFSAYDANERLLNSLAVTSPSKYWDWSAEPTPYDILRDMGFSPYEADAVLNFVNVKDAYSSIFSFSD